MDDFYVYYEMQPVNMRQGVIKAITPNALPEFDSLDVIRIPAEKGLEFTVGTASLNRWTVCYDPRTESMQMMEWEPEIISESAAVFLVQLPTMQRKPEVTVTFRRKKKTFNVQSVHNPDLPNVHLVFFVTRLDDPNIPHSNFKIDLYSTMAEGGADFVCTDDLPERFSVYTKPEFDRYKLKVLA